MERQTLGNGVKMKVDKEATEAKVHIMGDFRLSSLNLEQLPDSLGKTELIGEDEGCTFL
ncbi:hypothetical protein NXX23_26405 [Bacteroides ovatus]|nr:hypothetical protein [Bacteroides ovatus]